MQLDLRELYRKKKVTEVVQTNEQRGKTKETWTPATEAACIHQQQETWGGLLWKQKQVNN